MSTLSSFLLKKYIIISETGVLHKDSSPHNVSTPWYNGTTVTMSGCDRLAVPRPAQNKSGDYYEMTGETREIYEMYCWYWNFRN